MSQEIAILCGEAEYTLIEKQLQHKPIKVQGQDNVVLNHIVDLTTLINKVQSGTFAIIVLAGIKDQHERELKQIRQADMPKDRIYIIGSIDYPDIMDGTIPHILQGEWSELLAGVRKAIVLLTNSSNN